MKRNFLSTCFLMLLCAGIGIWMGRYRLPNLPAPAAPTGSNCRCDQ